MNCGSITRFALVVLTATATAAGCAVEGGSGDDDDTGESGDDDDDDDDSMTSPDDDGPEDTGPEDTGPEDTGPDDTGPDDTGPEDTGTTGGECDVSLGDVDETPCAPLATDYVPDSADDPYAACVADSGEWTLIGGPPSTAARVEAYEDIVALLRGDTPPDADAFTEARALYATDSGLESRVLRREDVHYPPIPEEDQNPKVAFDQQCTILENAKMYPDRCVGPAKMAPIIDAAFADGMTDTGEPVVNAARIDATLQWFLFVSAYKEAASCVAIPDNCDSSWAYYGGATDRDNPLGLGANVLEISPMAHNMIYDAELAMLCWRDLYPPIDGTPSWEEVDEDGQALFEGGHEQLDNALWYGWARLVRSYLEAQQPGVCSMEADANWAFLQVAGPVLTPEAETRDGTAAMDLAIWGEDTAPDAAGLEAAVAALDVLFPCPQCETCEVTEGWGY
jgi:hypothetical protein